MPVYRRIDAEEDTSVRSGRGVGDGENVMIRSIRRWNSGRRTLRKKRAETEQWGIGSVPDDGLDARRVDSRRYTHASSLRNGGDSPCVEWLSLIVDVNAWLRAVEADHTDGGW